MVPQVSDAGVIHLGKLGADGDAPPQGLLSGDPPALLGARDRGLGARGLVGAQIVELPLLNFGLALLLEAHGLAELGLGIAQVHADALVGQVEQT